MEIITSPLTPILDLLAVAIGLTAITFIAIILYLDLDHKDEPLKLPFKR